MSLFFEACWEAPAGAEVCCSDLRLVLDVLGTTSSVDPLSPLPVALRGRRNLGILKYISLMKRCGCFRRISSRLICCEIFPSHLHEHFLAALQAFVDKTEGGPSTDGIVDNAATLAAYSDAFGGRRMVVWRTRGARTLRHHFNMAQFPFDTHCLAIRVRSRAAEPVQLLPNSAFPSDPPPAALYISASELWEFPTADTEEAEAGPADSAPRLDPDEGHIARLAAFSDAAHDELYRAAVEAAYAARAAVQGAYAVSGRWLPQPEAQKPSPIGPEDRARRLASPSVRACCRRHLPLTWHRRRKTCRLPRTWMSGLCWWTRTRA